MAQQNQVDIGQDSELTADMTSDRTAADTVLDLEGDIQLETTVEDDEDMIVNDKTIETKTAAMATADRSVANGDKKQRKSKSS